MTCPHCGGSGLDPDWVPCQASGCQERAEWEGWYRVLDGFGVPTGLVRRGYACKAHTTLFIGQVPESA